MDYQEQARIRQEWLDSLKEGDSVAYNFGGFGYKNYKITTISKITPKRLFIVDELRFNKEGIYRFDSMWSTRYTLQPVTDEITEKVKTKNMLHILSKVQFHELDLETLEKIVHVIFPENKEVISE